VTRFAACFLSVFSDIAFGGMVAISIPPFFKIERGFYKSSAGVYLGAGLLGVFGLAALASRGKEAGAPSAPWLWMVAGIWLVFCLFCALYMVTLWNDNGHVRSRAYSSALLFGLIAVGANAISLMPAGFGPIAGAAYVLTAIASSIVLGLASAGMLFGHWYLIDPNLPVDYLRTLVRVFGYALVGYLGVIVITLVAIAATTGDAGALFGANWILLGLRLVLGPIASVILVWMTWQTLKIPQTMAATGLLYIATMSVLVGEFLGRFIMFRTAIPL
jgi:hypothetical protein